VNSSKKTVYRYKLQIGWSEPDQLFVAHVPELEGCIADGRTYEEAVKAIEKAIQEWIEIAKEEGWPIPNPQPIVTV